VKSKGHTVHHGGSELEIEMTLDTLLRNCPAKSILELSRGMGAYEAVPFEFRPSNCRANKFPSHLSRSGTIPRMKKSHTRHPGAQKPTPGPFPTGPVLNLA
jgi:hypothetical protein